MKLLNSADNAISINKTFSPINPGPLIESIANTFRSGTYTQKVAETDLILTRYWGGNAREFGSFWSLNARGPLASRIESAVLPEWGNTFENFTTIKIPRGTVYFEGIAAPQKTAQGQLVGGGIQIFLPKVNSLWKVN